MDFALNPEIEFETTRRLSGRYDLAHSSKSRWTLRLRRPRIAAAGKKKKNGRRARISVERPGAGRLKAGSAQFAQATMLAPASYYTVKAFG